MPSLAKSLLFSTIRKREMPDKMYANEMLEIFKYLFAKRIDHVLTKREYFFALVSNYFSLFSLRHSEPFLMRKSTTLKTTSALSSTSTAVR